MENFHFFKCRNLDHHPRWNSHFYPIWKHNINIRTSIPSKDINLLPSLYFNSTGCLKTVFWSSDKWAYIAHIVNDPLIFGRNLNTVKFLNFRMPENFAVAILNLRKEAKHQGISSKRWKWNSKQCRPWSDCSSKRCSEGNGICPSDKLNCF